MQNIILVHKATPFNGTSVMGPLCSWSHGDTGTLAASKHVGEVVTTDNVVIDR